MRLYIWFGRVFENVFRARISFEHLAAPPPPRCREFAARKWRIVSQIRFESGKGALVGDEWDVMPGLPWLLHSSPFLDLSNPSEFPVRISGCDVTSVAQEQVNPAAQNRLSIPPLFKPFRSCRGAIFASTHNDRKCARFKLVNAYYFVCVCICEEGLCKE